MTDDGYTRITLRIPDELHAKLTAEASRTSKSMNAEIVARLEATFDGTMLTIPQAQELAGKVAQQVTDEVIARIIDPLDEPTFATVLEAIRTTPRPKPQEQGSATKRIAQRPRPKTAT